MSPGIQKRIQSKINELIIDTRPNGVKKLQSNENFYRIRVGYYRVIYEIKDDFLLVIVIKIKHRSKVYQNDSRSYEIIDLKTHLKNLYKNLNFSQEKLI